MLEPSVRNDLIEILSLNFTTKELSELGRLLFKDYDAHAWMDVRKHITISPRKHAEFLTDLCERRRKTKRFIKLLIELDDRIVLGKHLTINGIEFFLHHLALQGYTYDPRSRKILDCTHDRQELTNWGSLLDNKIYDIAVMSIDIVGNSKLVKRHGIRTMESFYYQFWRFLKDKLELYDGRLWSWAGDGGICAFTFKDHVDRAVLFAVDLQNGMSVFNMRPGKPIKENIETRIGIDCGKVKFFSNTGRIVSDTVNYAAHLEKRSTDPGKITITEKVYRTLDPSITSIFVKGDSFEGRECWTTYRRLDGLYIDRPKKSRSAKTRQSRLDTA
jgi:class 3 adenylate cyclase